MSPSQPQQLPNSGTPWSPLVFARSQGRRPGARLRQPRNTLQGRRATQARRSCCVWRGGALPSPPTRGDESPPLPRRCRLAASGRGGGQWRSCMLGVGSADTIIFLEIPFSLYKFMHWPLPSRLPDPTGFWGWLRHYGDGGLGRAVWQIGHLSRPMGATR
jgi:hypothetical protein